MSRLCSFLGLDLGKTLSISESNVYNLMVKKLGVGGKNLSSESILSLLDDKHARHQWRL